MSKSQRPADAIANGNEITTAQGRQRLETLLLDALKNETNTLINAPTSLGKSTTTASQPWGDLHEITGGQPVIVFHLTKQARDDAAEISRAAGLDVIVLLGREDACVVARGDYDDELETVDGLRPSEWFQKRCDVEGITFGRAHREFARIHDGLPCCEDGDCHSAKQWSRLAQSINGEESVDIVHATANFARVDWLVEGNNVIFDEQPDFTAKLREHEQDNLRRAIQNILKKRADGQMWYSGLLHAIKEGEAEMLEAYREVLAEDQPTKWLFQRGNVHASATEIARALTNAKPVGKNRYRGSDGSTIVVLDDEETLHIHQRVNLSAARCVVGLDAHPTELLWKLNTIEDLAVRRVLTKEEQRYWRVHKRNLRVIQVGNTTNYVTRKWLSEEAKQKAIRITEALCEHYGTELRTAISSKEVQSDVEDWLRSNGVEDPDVLYYNKLRSSNQFKDESVGLLVGCIDAGDDYVLNMLAMCGLRAEVTRENGQREFIGPDSDAAEAFVASVRENNVAQAAGRYARRPEDDDDGATVYVLTDAIPEELVDETVPGITSGKVTESMREIEKYVRNHSPATTTEVAENVDASRKHILDVLGRMADQDIVTVETAEKQNEPNVYTYEGGKLRRSIDLGL